MNIMKLTEYRNNGSLCDFNINKRQSDSGTSDMKFVIGQIKDAYWKAFDSLKNTERNGQT